MIRNEVFSNGVCVHAEIIDLSTATFTVEDYAQEVFTRPLTAVELQEYNPQPLDSTGALATLLAVTKTVTVTDAANAVGLTADDLVAEAEGWAIGAALLLETGPEDLSAPLTGEVP